MRRPLGPNYSGFQLVLVDECECKLCNGHSVDR
jgi:hypothetical protein